MELKGNSKGIQKLDDFEVFEQKFRELAPKFGDEAAAKAAMAFANNSIALGAQQGNLKFTSALAADSLAKIGGGGNVASGTGNPLLTVAERQESLAKEANKYLKTIASKSGGLTVKS